MGYRGRENEDSEERGDGHRRNKGGVRDFFKRHLWAMAIALVILLVIGGIYAFTSWVNIGQGRALIVVDTRARTTSLVVIGPASGFMVNGFDRILGIVQPEVVYFAMDSISMWTEWEEQALPGGNGTTVFVEKARGITRQSTSYQTIVCQLMLISRSNGP